ncbi:MAG TPA: TAXI family TRAP transporter solute-binding subunit [Rhodocyclaceae bacterium]
MSEPKTRSRPAADTGELRSRLPLVLATLAIAAGLALAAWLLFSFVRPAPPRVVTLVTGTPGGAYALFAERYRSALAREGIELRLLPSSGSVENLRRLKTEPDVDLGFVQSGIASEPESTDLAVLGSMYLEPVWIFHRSPRPLTRLTELQGKRVAVGAPGSGTQLLALQLLANTGISIGDPGLLALDEAEAAEALLAGRIDAAFLVAAPQAPAVEQLLGTPGIQLLDLAHAEAYARRFPHLAPITLPAGAIDLGLPNPTSDRRLLGATASLIARADLHPAIVNLLLQAAREVHGAPGLFQRAGEYPQQLSGRDLPVHPAAKRYFEYGPPFLQRYLPFWLAVLADRLLIALLPIVALAIPLFRIAPAIYAWRKRSRIYRWYGELKFLEADIHENFSADRLDAYLEDLERIEELANRRRVPLAFSNELYTLREHIQLVRRELMQRAERAGATALTTARPGREG